MSMPLHGVPTRRSPDWRSAGDLRREWARLQQELDATIARVQEGELHDHRPGDAPTVAQQLAHLGQSMSFFANQLDEWLAARRAVLGRPVGGDADEHDALERATVMRLGPLLHEVATGQARTTDVIQRITDGHAYAWVTEVDAGRYPLITYVSRTVLRHTHQHVDQLAAVLDRSCGSAGIQ